MEGATVELTRYGRAGRQASKILKDKKIIATYVRTYSNTLMNIITAL